MKFEFLCPVCERGCYVLTTRDAAFVYERDLCEHVRLEGDYVGEKVYTFFPHPEMEWTLEKVLVLLNTRERGRNV